MNPQPSAGRLLSLGLAMLAILIAWTSPADAQTRSRLGPDDLKDGSKVLKAFESVAAKANPATVRVLRDGKPAAIGVFVTTRGHVLTKASQLSEGPVAVRFGTREYEATSIGVDADTDLALLRIEATDTPPILWSTAEDPAVGHWLISVAPEAGVTAVGIVSSPRRKIEGSNGVLGILLGEERDGGVAVSQVFPDSGAAAAGLQADDVVRKVNAAPTRTRAALINVIRKYKAGQIVKVTVNREGEDREVDVTLGYAPAGFGGRQAVMDAMGGDLSLRREDFEAAIGHDSVLVPSDCGGPVVTLDGDVIGLNIARAGRTESLLLPAEIVRRSLRKLLAADPMKDTADDSSSDEAAARTPVSLPAEESPSPEPVGASPVEIQGQ